MTLARAKDFTLHKIIFGDMLLNWFLGIVLLLFPGFVDDLVGVGNTPVLPLIAYRAMGLLFLGFAAWQTWIVRRDDIEVPGLVFAALMAEGPVVVLTIALLSWNLPIYPIVRAVLWIGNIYMFFLGGWYLVLAYRINKSRTRAA